MKLKKKIVYKYKYKYKIYKLSIHLSEFSFKNKRIFDS